MNYADFADGLWEVTIGEAILNGTHVKFDTSDYVQEGHAIVIQINPNCIRVVSREKLTQNQALSVLNNYYENEALKQLKDA